MAASTVLPDVFEAPLAIPQTNRNGWASKEDWIKHQTLIGQLYRQQSLAQVMAFMEKEHHFRATEKMYKTRIKQWGLDKKHKENEMRAIVRKTKTLGSQGKSATFRVRGRAVDYKDVVRYFERKDVRIEDAINQRTGSKTPEAVDCLITVPSPITTPESIAIPERILVSIRDYFRGSFENGTWVVRDPQIGCETMRAQGRTNLDHMFDDCQAACLLFAENHFQEAGQSLIAASARIRGVILAEHPDTLECILKITRQLLREKRYEIALAILRQYSALGEIIICKTHPIGGVCGWLTSLAPSQLDTVIERCMDSIVNHFEGLAGSMNMSTVNSRLYHIEYEVDTEYNINHSLLLLKDLLHSCDTMLGPQDLRTGKVRLHLAWYYFNLFHFAEAMEVSWDLITCAHHFVDREGGFYFYTEGFYMVARSEYALGDIYSAEAHLRRAIDIFVSEYGPNYSRVRSFLVILEAWLVQQGQLSSAAQVQKRWRESLLACTDYV